MQIAKKQEFLHFFVGLSVLGTINTNPRVHSLCLFWSDWRKVCATSAAVAGGNPGPVPWERGTGRGCTPGRSCARSDQTVRLGTQEQVHGMDFHLCLSLEVRATALGLAPSLRLRSVCCPCQAQVLRTKGCGSSPSCRCSQP